MQPPPRISNELPDPGMLTMEINGPSRSRYPKSTSTDRFLGVYPHMLLSKSDHPSSVTEELNEDDIFFSGDFSVNSNGSNSSGGLPSSLKYQTTSPSSSPRNHKSFSRSENFGILAAIRDPSRPHSHFYQKPSISTSASSSSSATSASSSSRFITSIPKPPQERIRVVSSSSSSLGRFHQSGPINVPMLAKPMRKNRDFDDGYDADMVEEGEMLPPHEIVARSLAQSSTLPCSVLEGVGRTLKGRDLRQVRNAVWRQTGFLD